MSRILLLLFGACAAMALVGCGGSGPSEPSAACAIERSAMGPFASDQPLGATMGEEAASARMADEGAVEFIEISAEGTWGDAWDQATATLGQGIHTDLTWIDVEGDLFDVYSDGATLQFSGLRVSRSFQGKIEDADQPLFVPVTAEEQGTVNYDAACTVTAVVVGDQANPALLDVASVYESAAS